MKPTEEEAKRYYQSFIAWLTAFHPLEAMQAKFRGGRQRTIHPSHKGLGANDHERQQMTFEYSVFTKDGQENVRQSQTNDTEQVMALVLAEFDESEIDTVTLKTEPRNQ